MKDTVDPRLVKQIEQARDDEEVEAVVVLDRSSAVVAAADDERGVAGPVLDRVVKAAQQEPSRVRFLPKLGAVYLKGRPELVRQLLGEAEVSSATAMDDDFYVEE